MNSLISAILVAVLAEVIVKNLGAKKDPFVFSGGVNYLGQTPAQLYLQNHPGATTYDNGVPLSANVIVNSNGSFQVADNSTDDAPATGDPFFDAAYNAPGSETVFLGEEGGLSQPKGNPFGGINPGD